MPGSDFPDFRLHSEWAEENWYSARAPDGFEQGFAAQRMVAIDYDGSEGIPRNDVVQRLFSCQEPRLQTSEFHQQTQQRSDNLLARQYQHIAQRHQPRGDAASRQLMDLQALVFRIN